MASGQYQSPVTITAAGTVRSSGVDGVYSGRSDATLTNAGVILNAGVAVPFGKYTAVVFGNNVISPRAFQKRHLIENFFAKLKQFRAIATRYDKTARNFLAGVHLAAAAIWLN